MHVTLAGSPTHWVEAICDAWALSCAEERSVEPLDAIPRDPVSPRDSLQKLGAAVTATAEERQVDQRDPAGRKSRLALAHVGDYARRGPAAARKHSTAASVRPPRRASVFRLLVETMYGGRRERIVLPPGVAAVAFGG